MYLLSLSRFHLPTSFKSAACLGAGLALLAGQSGFAGFAESSDESHRNSVPVAFVYVSYTPSGGSTNMIAGYSAAANGQLTTVSGSPFAGSVTSMAVNGRYLFGSDLGGVNVDTFRIRRNGALASVGATDVAQFEPSGCVYPTPLVLDHTGASLYRLQIVGGLCEESEFQSFTIDKATGMLQYIGTSAQRFLFNTPLSFSGDNKFAYGSECTYYRTGYLDTMAGLVRHTDGLLDYASITVPTPAAEKAGDVYCRAYTAADPANHVAVSMQPIDVNLEDYDGPPQLGTYTADASGNLTTASTFSNMPTSAVGYVFGLNMSPSGRLLAVGGTGGLQVFHFNGSAPITAYTGLLTTDQINQLYWDNNNHLYALSKASGKLYVFTVTPGSVSQAPGSPYLITAPSELIVQPEAAVRGERDDD